MKPRISNILLAAILLTSFAQDAVARKPDDTSQRLFVTVVIDSSPTSVQTWRQLKASACQAIDSLRENDRVEILRTRVGEPALHSDSLIRSATTSSRQNLRQCIRDIRQVFFLSRADVAKAVAVAFEHIGKHSGEYRCAVLVVSTGGLSDDQVRQIRRLAEAYRFRNWSLAFLVQQNANRNLFVAASQGEFDVMFNEKANVAQWLEKVRADGSTTAEQTQEPQRLSPLQKSQHVESEAATPTPPTLPPPQLTPESEAEPLPTPGRPERPQSQTEPNGPTTRYILPVYPVPQDRLPLPTLPQVRQPLPDPATSAKAEKQPWLKPLLKSKYVTAVAAGAVILGLIVLVLLAAKLRQSGEGLPDLDEYGTDDTPQKLMCSAGDQEYDLGEEENVDTLIIGKSPASAIPLPDDDDQLEDEHIKVIKRRHGYTIKNLAEQPIVVDGSAVKKGRKLDLFLPATIELTRQSRINLSRAPVLEPGYQMQTIGENHETDNI